MDLAVDGEEGVRVRFERDRERETGAGIRQRLGRGHRRRRGRDGRGDRDGGGRGSRNAAERVGRGGVGAPGARLASRRGSGRRHSRRRPRRGEARRRSEDPEGMAPLGHRGHDRARKAVSARRRTSANRRRRETAGEEGVRNGRRRAREPFHGSRLRRLGIRVVGPDVEDGTTPGRERRDVVGDLLQGDGEVVLQLGAGRVPVRPRSFSRAR